MPARPCHVRSLQLLDVARPVPIQPACSISSTATNRAWALSRSSASLVQEVSQVYEGSCYFCVSGSLGNPQPVTRVLATFFGVAGHRNGSSGSFDGALNKPGSHFCQNMPCQIVVRVATPIIDVSVGPGRRLRSAPLFAVSRNRGALRDGGGYDGNLHLRTCNRRTERHE